MLVDIINDLKNNYVKSPSALFEQLLTARLQKAVVSYYSDLNSKFSSYENMLEIDTLATAKKLIKRFEFYNNM